MDRIKEKGGFFLLSVCSVISVVKKCANTLDPMFCDNFLPQRSQSTQREERKKSFSSVHPAVFLFRFMRMPPQRAHIHMGMDEIV